IGISIVIEWFWLPGLVGYIWLCTRLVLPRFSGSVCLNLNLLSESVVMSAVESAALSAAVCLNLLVMHLSESVAVVCLYCSRSSSYLCDSMLCTCLNLHLSESASV
ncbi:hypothetical protein Tco_0077011, partial [Tanacetum coccineum]